jgi:hypothetical protein
VCSRCGQQFRSFTVDKGEGQVTVTLACKGCTRDTGEPWVFRWVIRSKDEDRLERWFPNR